jgi:hypothetical protein
MGNDWIWVGILPKLAFFKWYDKEAKGIRCYKDLYLQERSQEKELMIKSKF